MTPIEKNITVIDDFGKEYEATYPKRARGLVKKGRARFVDENTICLACPPDITEDTNMSDNKNANAVNEQEVKKAAVAEALKEVKPAEDAMPTVAYVLKQIELIRQDNEHINRALNALMAIKTGVGPGDVAGQEQAKGIADTVKCRETTNQKLISFYEKLYSDLKPKKLDIDDIIEAIERVDAEMQNRDLANALINDLRAAYLNLLVV